MEVLTKTQQRLDRARSVSDLVDGGRQLEGWVRVGQGVQGVSPISLYDYDKHYKEYFEHNTTLEIQAVYNKYKAKRVFQNTSAKINLLMTPVMISIWRESANRDKLCQKLFDENRMKIRSQSEFSV